MQGARGGHWTDLRADGVLFCLVALVFGRSIRFPFVAWEDPRVVFQNPLIRHPLAEGLTGLFGTTHLGDPEPLTLLLGHLDFALGAGKPWAFHLTSVLLHAGSAVLVRRLAVGFGAARGAALLSAALFAVHPVSVEPVCWASGQRDVLATFGVLLAALCCRSPSSAGRAATVAALLVAFGAKASGWVAPVYLALVFVATRTRPSAFARGVTAAFGALALLLAPLAFRSRLAHGGLLERAASDRARFVVEHLAVQLRNVVAPVLLSPVYLEHLPRPWLSGWGLAGLALFGVVLALGVFAWKRRNAGAVFGLAASLAAFAPASGIIAMRRGPSDSYFYLCLAGLSIALAAGTSGAFTARPLLARAISSLVVLVYGGLGLLQVGTWRGSVFVWQPAVSLYPKDSFANENLAKALLFEGDRRWGLFYYERAVRLAPYPPKRPDPLLALGLGSFQLGERSRALRWYGEAVRHYPLDVGRAIRLVSARLASQAPGYERESLLALGVVEGALSSLEALPEPERTVETRRLYVRYLAQDRVPLVALERFRMRSDIGRVAGALIGFYGVAVL